MKTRYKIGLFTCLFLLFASLLSAQNNNFNIGGGPGELKITINDNGYYFVERESSPGSGIWQKQFFSSTTLFTIRIGNDSYNSYNFTIGNDVISQVGTRGTYSKTYSLVHYTSGEPFSVIIRTIYDTSNPDYFLIEAEIDASKITTGETISFAYGYDAYVNNCDGGAAWILPDPSGYNGIDASRNLTSAEVNSLQFVGGINDRGTGSLMGFFPVGRPFDRAYSAFYTRAFPYEVIVSTQNNLFKFGPAMVPNCQGNGIWDNGVGVVYDNILSGTTTIISTGLTFTTSLDGTLDYTWENVKNKTASIGDNVMLNLIHKNLGAGMLTNVAFRTDFPGLAISAACTMTGWSGGTSTSAVGDSYYKLSNASLAGSATATVDVPITVTQYGEWVVNAGSISETSKTLPIGAPATLTAPTKVNISAVSQSIICPGASFDVTVKLDGTAATSEDIVINLDYTGSTVVPSDYISLPTSITIPAGSNSATFTITSTSIAADNHSFNITLTATDKSWATIGTNKTGQVVVKHNANPLLNSVLNTTACSGAVFSYNATSASIAPTTYSWSRAEVAGISNSAANGTSNLITETLLNTTSNPIDVAYEITLSAGGCINTQSVIVTVYPTLPFLGLNDLTICSGSSATITIPNPITGATYTWFSQGTQIHIGNSYTTPILTSDAVYTVSVSGTTCPLAPNSATVNVTVNPIPVIGVSDVSICPGNTAILVEPNPVMGATYEWYSGASLVHTGISFTTPILTANTSYRVEMSGVACPPQPKTVNVSLFPPWPISITASADKVCYNNSVDMQLSGVNSSYTYNVYKDAALTQLVTSASGTYASTINNGNNLTESTTYYIQEVDSNGCTSGVLPLYVEVVNLDIKPDTLPDYRKGQPYNLQLRVDADYPLFSLIAGDLPVGLSFNSNGVIQGTVPYDYVNNKDHNFTVQVSDINGCQDAKAFLLKSELFIPEVFTPNGDGINDHFMKGYRVIIFDRLGVQLFEGNDGWDGTHKGKPLPSDTYFYILYNTDNATGNEKRYTGYIMILKR